MHDVAVVGSGHNGLICAAYLARAGLDVVVFEARSNVGGCAATVDALGTRVNICNCDHLLVRSTPIVEELDLGLHGLRYLEVDPVQLSLSWDGAESWFLFRDVERTLDSLRLSYPGEVESYRRYLRAAVPAAQLVVELANAAPTVGSVGAALVRRRSAGLRTLLAWGRRSLDEVLRGYFSNDALRAPAAVTGPALAGVPPTTPGTGSAALGYALRHLVPSGRPVGGSGALTDAIAASVLAGGGAIRTSSPVADVIVEATRVRGVTLAGGEEVRARAVVVACDPRVPRVRWIGSPLRGVARYERWRQRPGPDGHQSKLDAVVVAPPRYRALNSEAAQRLGVDEPLVPTTVVAPTSAAIGAAHATMRMGSVPTRPPYLVNVPSVVDPSMRLPTGEHVFSLETLFTPYGLEGGWSGNRSEPERWLEGIASLAEPGFLEGVRRWRVSTPEDYERDMGQPRGQALYYRVPPLAAVLGLQPELTRYRTPIVNLFLTGVATYPGGGIWGAPGRNAAGVIERALAT